jgi:hypothetical protein
VLGDFNLEAKAEAVFIPEGLGGDTGAVKVTGDEVSLLPTDTDSLGLLFGVSAIVKVFGKRLNSKMQANTAVG